jgi:hypothetical protein
MGKEPVSAGSGLGDGMVPPAVFSLRAALPGKERVLARLGQAGVIVGLFEHSLS